MNSMTGFGAATAPLKGASLRIEISSVNRKQAEVVVALPRAWAELESRVRDYVAARVSRGRVSVAVTLQATESTARPLALHVGKLQELSARLEEVRVLTGQLVPPTLDALLRLGILTEETEAQISPEELWQGVQPVLEEALVAFLRMRGREGEHLREDLLARLETLRTFRERIMQVAPTVVQHHREALMKRLTEAGLPLELTDERLVKEVALFADKCDVTEEVTRLASHLQQFEQLCTGGEAVGRTLDFLCQEIFRELNTTGSKANSAELAQVVVAAKTELEKIREQVQNVE